jgi:hypothetical protein
MAPENKKHIRGMLISNRRQFLSRSAIGAGALALAGKGESQSGGRSSSAVSPSAWKFGVMNDTQWTVPDDGYDPATCAVGVIKQIQRQFIAQDVKFVIHVGDLCDNGSLAGEDVRALYAQPLYDNGIGFFPLRGNHDDGATQAVESTRRHRTESTTRHPPASGARWRATCSTFGAWARRWALPRPTASRCR